MNNPNVLVLNTLAQKKKNQLNDIFKDEAHFYKALALYEMGYPDDYILEYLKEEIITYNEFQNTLLQELKKRNENITQDV